MKKILLVLFSTLCFITGCSNFNIGEKSDIKIEKNNVKFYIKEGTLTNDEATFILENNSDKTLNYGEPFEIEIYEDKSWKKIEVELNFIMPLYDLKPGEKTELNINWFYGYGSLNKGKYRLIKSVCFEGEDAFYVASEFEV